jgi:hypothetical protein
MNPRVDRANRVVLLLLGLLLLAAGGTGLALGFGQHWGETAVLPAAATGFMASNHSWFWPTVVAAAVVLALLGLVWVTAQLRTDRVSQLELASEPAAGSTMLLSRALLDAVGNEIADYDGVWRATARMSGRPSRPRLVLKVIVEPGADLGAVRRQVESEAIVHVRAALETDVPVRIEFGVAGGAPVRTLA